MPNHYSNDGLLYDTLHRGNGARLAREDFMNAMYFDGINVEFEDDYSPIISFNRGVWSDQLNQDSTFYGQVIQRLYFEFFHCMQAEHIHMRALRNMQLKYPDMGTTREALQGRLATYKEDNGSKYYITIFLEALLSKTDFTENENFVMPDYRRRN